MPSLKIPATMANLDKMINFIESGAKGIDFSKKQNYNIKLASEEILVNIINYAYPENNGDIEIEFRIQDKKGGIELTFIDWGTPFDPLSKEDPVINLPIEDREIGGLGIHLIQQTMDDVEYKREEDKNILIIRLYKSKQH